MKLFKYYLNCSYLKFEHQVIETNRKHRKEKRVKIFKKVKILDLYCCGSNKWLIRLSCGFSGIKNFFGYKPFNVGLIEEFYTKFIFLYTFGDAEPCLPIYKELHEDSVNDFATCAICHQLILKYNELLTFFAIYKLGGTEAIKNYLESINIKDET